MSLRVTDRRNTLVAAALTVAAVTAVPGCSSGCDARITVEPVTVQGGGKEIVHLDLAANVTLDGRAAPGVDVVFEIGWPSGGSGGRNIGSVKTGADGVARLHVENAVGPLSAMGEKAAEWTKYTAEPSLIQPSDEAAKAVCAGEAEAAFRYEP